MSPVPSTSGGLYRGRLAPSPTGYLHLGHARTFWTAEIRAQEQSGALILRNEDLDPDRSKPAYVEAFIEDLQWFGLQWTEGPDRGGPFGPYSQSDRREFYVDAFQMLWQNGFIYPCQCSRRDVQNSSQAPHAADEEPVYPGTCRNDAALRSFAESFLPQKIPRPRGMVSGSPKKLNWRFRVPDGDSIAFFDGNMGSQQFVAGRDFGDFITWRHDDVPSYQLAVTVDDAFMKITEVVRGSDLLVSAARQLLLYRALGYQPPAFYHCPLMTDAQGIRLAKRSDALSLRALRAAGRSPEELRQGW